MFSIISSYVECESMKRNGTRIFSFSSETGVRAMGTYHRTNKTPRKNSNLTDDSLLSTYFFIFLSPRIKYQFRAFTFVFLRPTCDFPFPRVPPKCLETFRLLLFYAVYIYSFNSIILVGKTSRFNFNLTDVGVKRMVCFSFFRSYSYLY